MIKLLRSQAGAVAAEYALLAVLIAAAVATAVGIFGDSVEDLFGKVVF